MTSFASFMNPFFAMPQGQAVAMQNPASAMRLESAAFTHALVALAAKLATVDGTPNKAEYAAFHALFVDEQAGDAAQLRSLFVKRVSDVSPALQYARQIAGMTQGQGALHRDLIQRLLRVATADAALNAAELELLRAVAHVFGIEKETFRAMITQTMTPISSSPYEVLGISAKVTDAQLREHYMRRVQTLHPDRYQAAGASADTIALLSDQLAGVNAAYQAIMKVRSKKSSRSGVSPASWWRKNTKGAAAL